MFNNNINLKNLFGYYNLYQDVYIDSGCSPVDPNNVEGVNHFYDNWFSYIICVDVKSLANMVEYVTQNKDIITDNDDSKMEESDDDEVEEKFSRKVSGDDAVRTLVSMANDNTGMNTSKGGTKKAKKTKRAKKTKKAKKTKRARKTKKAKKTKKARKSKKAK